MADHPACDKGEPIEKIKEDVAYIRGRIDEMHEINGRVSSLESTARNQNIIGSIVAMGLACLAWLKE